MEIIVESAALYAISALVYTPMLADSSPDASVATYYLYAEMLFAYMAVECHLSYPLSSSPDCSSQNFAPALIMLRVVLGRARPDTEWSRKISGLQFNFSPGIQQESARSRDATGTIVTVPRSHNGEEVDLEANGESRTESSDAEGMNGADDLKAKLSYA
jgi:hypothetical protein